VADIENVDFVRVYRHLLDYFVGDVSHSNIVYQIEAYIRENNPEADGLETQILKMLVESGFVKYVSFDKCRIIMDRSLMR